MVNVQMCNHVWAPVALCCAANLCLYVFMNRAGKCHQLLIKALVFKQSSAGAPPQEGSRGQGIGYACDRTVL